MSLPPRHSGRRAQRKPEHMTPDGAGSLCVIGGGIAGVCCAQELSRLHAHKDIVLISCTDVLRVVTSVMKLTSNLEELSVFERRADQFCMDNKNIRVIFASLTDIDTERKKLYLSNGDEIKYAQVCLCTGAQPRELFPKHKHSNVITIRDTESIEDMVNRLHTARRITIIGNGGIAMELVNVLTFCDVVWIIRESFIGSAFFDATASAFIAPSLLERAKVSGHTETNNSDDQSRALQSMRAPCASILDASEKRMRYTKQCQASTQESFHHIGSNDTSFSESNGINVNVNKQVPLESSTREETLNAMPNTHSYRPRQQGSALGPEWVSKSKFLQNLSQEMQERQGSLLIHFDDTVESLREISQTPKLCFPLQLQTKKNRLIECDFVITALGVTPNTECVGQKLLKDSDGAIVVNDFMQSSVPHVFAAGDCCTIRSKDLPEGNIVSSFLEHKSQCEDGMNRTPSLEPPPQAPLRAHRNWFQMKLWTQARTMGQYAAQCMYDLNVKELCSKSLVEPVANDMVFEVFAHVTRFFGYKVVLLGRYNAQGLSYDDKVESYVREIVVTEHGLVHKNHSTSIAQGAADTSLAAVVEPVLLAFQKKSEVSLPSNLSIVEQINTKKNIRLHELEIWTRVTPNKEYVKVVVFQGRVVGALLLGDTDLEETFENLILNKMDVSEIGIALLDPELDLESYWD